MELPAEAPIRDVGPRDGLQNERGVIGWPLGSHRGT